MQDPDEIGGGQSYIEGIHWAKGKLINTRAEGVHWAKGKLTGSRAVCSHYLARDVKTSTMFVVKQVQIMSIRLSV